MTFSAFWHILTTSRYTRKLEEENKLLREECSQVRGELNRLLKRSAFLDRVPPQDEELPEEVRAQVAQQRRRPGRFLSFGADKRRLESQEPPQRSVNV